MKGAPPYSSCITCDFRLLIGKSQNKVCFFVCLVLILSGNNKKEDHYGIK